MPELEIRDIDEFSSRVDQAFVAGLFARSYLEELPPGEREIMRLAFVDGLSTKEIAVKRGMSQGAVRVIKSKAVKRLRAIVARDAILLSKPGN